MAFDSPFTRLQRELLEQADFITMTGPFSNDQPGPQQQTCFNETFEPHRRQGDFIVYELHRLRTPADVRLAAT